jgi:hypothetical protein
VVERTFDRAMGLCAHVRQLHLATRSEMFRSAPNSGNSLNKSSAFGTASSGPVRWPERRRRRAGRPARRRALHRPEQRGLRLRWLCRRRGRATPSFPYASQFVCWEAARRRR